MNCHPSALDQAAPPALAAMLLEDDDLAVLDDPVDDAPPAAEFGAADRSALCEQLVDDHRFAPVLAAAVCRDVEAAPAANSQPDGAAVALLAQQLVERYGRRCAFDRGTATCLAVAVARRLARAGLAVTGLRPE